MNREKPRVLGIAVLFALLSQASVGAAATVEERAAARDHLSKGQALKKEGKLDEAVAELAESQRLDPKLMTLMDLADAEAQLGKLVEAQAHYAAARERAKQDSAPRTKATAEERLAQVEKRLAHLTVQLSADAQGAQVFRDEAALDAAALGTSVTMNPGEHHVVVKATGHDDAKYSVKLNEGDNQTLAVTWGAATAVAAPAPPPPPPPPPPKVQVSTDSVSSGSGQRTAGLVLGGVGLVGVGFGSYLWAIGARDANSLGPTADRNLLFGKISVISGAVLFGTGAVLFITAPGNQPQQTGLQLTPILDVTPDTAFLGATGQF